MENMYILLNNNFVIVYDMCKINITKMEGC